jgi:hypothetical protein
MKIDSHRVEIEETCKPEYIEAIKQYWALENNEFINKSTDLAKAFDLTAYAFSAIVKKESKFCLQIECDSCHNIETVQVKSQTNFATVKKDSYYSRTNKFNCSKCKALIQQQKLEVIEKQKQYLLEKQYSAIKNKNWLVLSPFELKVLRCIIKNEGISNLNYHFKNTSIKVLWSAIYTLRDLCLIVLHSNEDSNYVNRVTFLTELKTTLPEVEAVVKNEPKAKLNNVTQELKLRLTKNKAPKNGDSPVYSGVLNFPNDVLIEKGTQYTFGIWKREFDNLYFTLIPTDNIYQAPRQQAVSSQPKHLRDAIQDFFDSSEFDF